MNTVVNENKLVLEMFKTPEGGKEYKGMEIVYERASAASPVKPAIQD
jgi:hypothetical protein